jgi:hypothetical protein
MMKMIFNSMWNSLSDDEGTRETTGKDGNPPTKKKQ